MIAFGFIAVYKDSYVVYAYGFDRNGKWEWFCDYIAKIKRVVKTTDVWRHDDTTSRCYDVTTLWRYVLCDTPDQSVFFFQNALIEYIGVYTDTNDTNDAAKMT